VLPEHSTGCHCLSYGHGFGFCGGTTPIIQRDDDFEGIMATSVSGFNTPWLVSTLSKGKEFVKNANTKKIQETSRVQHMQVNIGSTIDIIGQKHLYETRKVACRTDECSENKGTQHLCEDSFIFCEI
jgi:hypothetical protein